MTDIREGDRVRVYNRVATVSTDYGGRSDRLMVIYEHGSPREHPVFAADVTVLEGSA